MFLKKPFYFRASLLFSVLIAPVVCLANKAASTSVVTSLGESASFSFSRLKFLGAGSCASAACHGNQGAVGAAGSEYPTWAAHDKHARAYDVLLQPRSVNIMSRLGRANAHEDTQCLSCHAHPRYDN